VADWQGLHQIQTIQTKISIDNISGDKSTTQLSIAFVSKYFTLAGNS
jgi:hypothetical protein